MDWNLILQYVPDAVCAFFSLFVLVKNGGLRKTFEKICPSFDSLIALQTRVDNLEFRLSELSSMLSNLVGGDKNAN